MPMTIMGITGARPNFMKIDPVLRALDKRVGRFETLLLHTGQHYDDKMAHVFFRDLGLRKPDIDLGVGSGSHAEQTGRVMIELERALLDRRPDLVVVVGDVNSTLAAAVTCAKLLIPLAHVEAGLRSHDRTMPEEINRIVTDALSEHLFTTSREADAHLRAEGIPGGKIHFVGNVMIDTLKRCLAAAKRSRILDEMSLQCQGRSKIRPRWRRKTRPPDRWAECLSAVVRTGWSGVWDRPWGGLRRSGNPCAQPAPSWGGGVRAPGRPRGGGPSCCVRGGSCRR